MSKGISIHIGVNRVDPNHYKDANGNGWDGALVACENDASSMLALVQGQGINENYVYLTKQATSANVIQAIEKAAASLESGDLLVMSYSGHGGQVPDRNSEFGEDDELDETWCLYDRQLIDDELYALWGKFKPGVRIFVLSDSCHSGSVTKDPFFSVVTSAPGMPAVKLLPDGVKEGTYRQNTSEYDQLQKDNPAGDQAEVKAAVVLISGCQDNQFSFDGNENGLFTGTLLKIWRKGKFKGSIKTFHKRIVDQMPLYQSPNLFKVGTGTSTAERKRPFAV